MRCPTCLENFNASETHSGLFDGRDNNRNSYAVITTVCSNSSCKQHIVFLSTTHYPDHSGLPPGMGSPPSTTNKMVLPRFVARPNVVLADIPNEYLEDYKEAVEVVDASAKASAALSRRVLQTLLREEANVDHSNLYSEIGQVVDASQLPSRLLSTLDAVREVGNFAAHPIKSTRSGEVVAVEPGEAELNLEVLEMLFDYYFTAPRLAQERINSINAKLTEAGKPTLEQVVADRQAKIDKKKTKDN